MNFVRATLELGGGMNLIAECVANRSVDAVHRIVSNDPIWRHGYPMSWIVKPHLGGKERICFYVNDAERVRVV